MTAQQPSPQDLTLMLAALVHRLGGNVKLKTSDFSKVDGKQFNIVAGRGHVRLKTGGGQ